MNTTIEIHDSNVAEIVIREGTIVVNFRPAYLHKSEGRPGFDSGSGRPVDFKDATSSGKIPILPLDVMDGSLVVGGELHDNLIPVPLMVSVPTELRLTSDSIHNLTVAGLVARLELLGEPRLCGRL